jgi:hypothetical protein
LGSIPKDPVPCAASRILPHHFADKPMHVAYHATTSDDQN